MKNKYRLTMGVLVVVLASSAVASLARADDDREHKSCHKGIVTACDLKSYANSNPSTAAYAFFQGYVFANIALDNSNPTCPLNVDNLTIVADVKKAVQSVANCATIKAQDLVNQVLQQEPRICF